LRARIPTSIKTAEAIPEVPEFASNTSAESTQSGSWEMELDPSESTSGQDFQDITDSYPPSEMSDQSGDVKELSEPFRSSATSELSPQFQIEKDVTNENASLPLCGKSHNLTNRTFNTYKTIRKIQKSSNLRPSMPVRQKTSLKFPPSSAPETFQYETGPRRPQVADSNGELKEE
jgi:hypothetical protein